MTELQQSDAGLIDAAYHRSLELLRRAATPYGFVASTENLGANYHAVWGRDSSICAIAAFMVDDPELESTAERTLLSLAENQAENGQIPSYILLDGNHKIQEVVHGGWGRITTIDSNLWFFIACQTAFFDRSLHEFIEDHLFEIYHRTMRHLESIDADACGLLEIPIAGDWSDILDRSYHILYDQVLWYRAQRCAALLCRERGEIDAQRKLDERADRIRARLNAEFWWDEHGKELARELYFIRHPLPEGELLYYQSHLEPFNNTWCHRFDAFGNILACLMGVAPTERIETIIRRVLASELHRPYPIRVLDPPIFPQDSDWNPLYETKERPYEYHNGGIWPLAGGFWILLLANYGWETEARKELAQLAQALMADRDDNGRDSGSWGFHEYFHGRTGAPAGHRYQAWDAASYLLAYKAIQQYHLACFERGII